MKPIEVLILAALTAEPLHGYALAMQVAELSGGRVEVRPGNLYRVLDRLEARGWVREAADPTGAAEDERRRYYRITAPGRRAVAAELRMYTQVDAWVRGLREGLADG